MSDAFQDDNSEIVPKFEDLVGEGKRYRDNEAVAKTIVEKDAYIKRLEAEAAEAREAAKTASEALSKRTNEADFLDRLEALSRGTQPDADPQGGREVAQPAAVKLEDIEDLIEKREAAKNRKANLDVAVVKLQEAFGDDYKRHVQKQALALGMTTAQLTEMAGTSPQAFLRLVGVEQRHTDVIDASPPRSSIQAPLMTQNPGSEKTYSYYSKLRREKGETWYFSLPVQKEIWENAKRLGGTPEDRTGFYKPSL